MNFSRNIYRLDISKLLRWLVPVSLRQPRTMAFIAAYGSTLQYVYAQFIGYKFNVEYDLTITPQYCYIQKALNDQFDFTQRRIRVVKGVYYPPQPLYLKIEGKPLVLYTKAEGTQDVFYQKSETQQFSSDFIVQVPQLMSFDIDRMKAVVNKYCLPGKIFSIQRIL